MTTISRPTADRKSWLISDVGSPDQCTTRIVHISDTHLYHDYLSPEIPSGDILIHSGDFFNIQSYQNFEEDAPIINKFLGGLPHKYKIFVAGNHDKCLHGKSSSEIQQLLPDVTYLQDDFVVINGLKIYGSPWNKDRGSVADAFVASKEDLKKYWKQIPSDTDVLVTHNPPWRIMCHGLGCKLLRQEVLDRIRPKVHLFGHAHRAEMDDMDGILFSNAAMGLMSGYTNVIDICSEQRPYNGEACDISKPTPPKETKV